MSSYSTHFPFAKESWLWTYSAIVHFQLRAPCWWLKAPFGWIIKCLNYIWLFRKKNMQQDSVSVPWNQDWHSAKFHFFSRSILTTSVIQTNQLWDELEKNMESFSKSRFLVLNALWNTPHSYNYLFHTCACRITSCMRLHTHGTINRMKPRWVYLPTCWLISLGLRKEKLALGGSCISSTFSRVAPTAWVGDSITGHLPFHPLPYAFVQLQHIPPRCCAFLLASVLQLGEISMG